MKRIVLTDEARQFLRNPISEDLLEKIGIGILITVIALVVLMLINYIFTSIAYATISKRRGINEGWLAWVPVFRYYIFGKIANEYDKRNGVNRKWHIATLLVALLLVAVTAVSAVNTYEFNMAVVEPAKEMWTDAYSDAMDIYSDAEEILEISGNYNRVFSSMRLMNDINELYENVKDGISETGENFADYALKGMLLNALGMILFTALNFLSAVCFYKAFEFIAPKWALFCFIISLLVPLAGAVCLFVCRNRGDEKPVPVNMAPVVQQAAAPRVASVQQVAPQKAPAPEAAPSPEVVQTPEDAAVSETESETAPAETSQQ